jgi:hypothetical protein
MMLGALLLTMVAHASQCSTLIMLRPLTSGQLLHQLDLRYCGRSGKSEHVICARAGLTGKSFFLSTYELEQLKLAIKAFAPAKQGPCDRMQAKSFVLSERDVCVDWKLPEARYLDSLANRYCRF